ncbi:MAG: hypothetical protein U0353_34330, partial [Sandaracinus sp.]
WPGMLDADRDGSLVSTVEPWPKGTSFRAVLEARRTKKKRFDAAELLPFVGRIAAALDRLPDRGGLAGLHHGDLRAGRVFIHPDGISLTGGFLLAALPGDVVAEALTRDVALRRALPPEFADGLAGRPADRHAVAALAWEALEGVPPPPSVQPADCRSEPALGAVLVRYLDPDPSSRPATLRALVDALAARASMPVPEHHDKLVLRGGSLESSEENRSDTGSYQLDDGELVPLDTRTEKMPASASAPKERGADLDPDLVAAAKATAAISETGTFQLDGEELVPVAKPAKGAKASTPRSASVPAASSRPSGRPLPKAAPLQRAASPKGSPEPPRAQKIEARKAEPQTASPPIPEAPAKNAAPRPDAETSSARRSDPAAKRTSPTPPAPRSDPPSQARTSDPGAATTAKRGRPTQPLGEMAAPLPRVEAPRPPDPPKPRASWEHSALPPSGAPLPSLQPLPAPAAPAPRPAVTTPPTPATSTSPPSGLESTGGWGGLALIVTAVIVALLILGAAFWYRAREEQLRHELEIEQRLRDLRQ